MEDRTLELERWHFIADDLYANLMRIVFNPRAHDPACGGAFFAVAVAVALTDKERRDTQQEWLENCSCHCRNLAEVHRRYTEARGVSGWQGRD